MTPEEIGVLLAQTRRDGRRLASYPEPAPASLAEAYAIQDAMIGAMQSDLIGWKVGATSRKAHEMLQISEPICAPLLASHIRASGAHIATAADHLRLLEAEICLRMASTPAPDATPQALAACVEAAAPAFELASKRLPGGPAERAEWLVADSAINDTIVTGSFVPLASDLAQETVVMRCDGVEETRGVGANALGGPLEVLAWLNGHLVARGRPLAAGDIVMTGLICDIVIAQPGRSYTATFGTLGSVTATF